MSKQKKGLFATLGGWLRRLFRGGANDLADQTLGKKNDINVEEVISPTKKIVRAFLDRKLAVCALCVLVAMIILVFVGPFFMPRYTDIYTEVTQKNVPPTMSMMRVPAALADDIKMIDSYGSFSVGLSNAGDVYVWGSTKLGTTGFDMKDIPEEIQNAKIVYIAAGIDHAIAIDENGKVYAWGSNKLGQYGYFDPETFPNIASMPDEILNGTIDVNNIKKVTCGYQCSAILMNDGTLYLWGNKNTYANIDNFMDRTDLVDIDFTLSYVVGLTEKGDSVYTGKRGLYDMFRSNISGEAILARDFLNGRKIVALYPTNSNIGVLLDDGTMGFTGDFPLQATQMPTLAEGEIITQVVSGTYHYSALTNLGNVYSWGGDVLGQCDLPDDLSGTTRIYGGAFQTYAVSEDNQLVEKWGLKGYLFGTDGTGANIAQRIIQGGKRTMTIGVVSVIISSIIGIIVGCISGYFGGKVDDLLMRITEIFNAIPFLPFAMILSAVMATKDISEDTKIFMMMVILGVLTWPGLARMVRGQVLVARENEYVTAAKSMGVKESTIAFKHILPNVVSIIFVNLTLNFATCLLTESSLSYLGFGVTYPRPTWGNMLNGANNATVIKNYWWQWVFTALFLSITCICINIIGDAMRDAMDPKADRDK